MSSTVLILEQAYIYPGRAWLEVGFARLVPCSLQTVAATVQKAGK